MTVEELISEFRERTKGSRSQRECYATYLADSRASAGYKSLLRDIHYPIVGSRAAGSHIWDVDGNSYIDLSMGFGVQLFGHAAPFVTDAIADQLALGIQLGPQARLAGEVAELIAKATGVERLCFCNTGTEAVMTALRLARTQTNRQKIAMFTWSYHGHFDGTLARPAMRDGERQSIPAFPGVPASLAADTVMLNYCDDAAFDVLEKESADLAAVIVEPIQSVQPWLRPGEFLRKLREWTTDRDVPLIFDDVLLGFRVHLGGSQAMFGVKPDIVTFGKILGGGLPIGVVAGDARYLEAIDGGAWTPANELTPSGRRTFFAGTYNKNPISMAAARAVLRRLLDEGPELQALLNETSETFTSELNRWLQDREIPIRIEGFGSLFRFRGRQLDLFFYKLLLNGVYLWEGRSCFLSTAHTKADLAELTSAIQDAALWWSEVGGRSDASPTSCRAKALDKP
ncbi:aspartate aminotransferase family protein [Ostreiculturibacter nitratireducens]|uniref:aspartate aminotransferase family protein n=1 Tax=Ostreiculturibacter nitratireducens TaxID=3075226 RepID=UPI0031B5BE7D